MTRITRIFSTLISGPVALLCIMGLIIGVIGAFPQGAIALNPEEMLANPAQEERARTLSKQVRCLVCQNQSIDDSDADLAKDLRREIRRQIAAGTNDDDILANLRNIYGDYVLLNPPVSPGTYILWGAPVLILLGGVGVLLANRRRFATKPTDDESADQTPEINQDQPDAKTRQDAESSPALVSRAMSTALVCGVIGLSLLLYLMLGRADLGDQPLASRTAEINAANAASSTALANQRAALAEARNAATTNPDKIEAWLQLAFAANQAGEAQIEINALEQVLEMTDGDPGVKSMLAEALSRAADGQVTVPARQLVAEALITNPNEPRALYISGLAAYQDEDYSKAIILWQRLQSVSRADAPWMALLADNIKDAAAKAGITPETSPETSAGPNAEDIAAAGELNADERLSMIEGMVEGLAERLAENPQDYDGWQRLARAYDVLGRPQQAVTALIGAADAADSDPSEQQNEQVAANVTALEYMITYGFEAEFSDTSERLLNRLDQLAPDGLERLFFRGHFAKQKGNSDDAKAYWQRLLDQLPNDAPFAAELATQISDL